MVQPPEYPPKFFTKPREEVIPPTPGNNPIELEERRVVALESIAQSLRIMARQDVIAGAPLDLDKTVLDS